MNRSQCDVPDEAYGVCADISTADGKASTHSMENGAGVTRYVMEVHRHEMSPIVSDWLARMSNPWELRRRGMKDSERHDARVKDAMKKNLRELISEEAIITSDGTRRVRIPIRYMDQYRFKYGHPQEHVGQGDGKPGDVLGRTGGQGKNPGDGMPGDQPGEETYEVEVSLEDLTTMMLEDLKLPWLEEKPLRQVESETIQHTDIRKKGSLANLDKRRTLRENIKRNAAKGHAEVGKIGDGDLRFRVWDVTHELHANASVHLLMDRSGSMTTSKKYIAKSFFFWMVRFLRLKYRRTEITFIAHDTEAAIVAEKGFFELSNSGGTRCSSAYELALADILEKYPSNGWNNYLFHFSDGDNLPYDNTACKTHVERLLELCTMVGYGEIRYGDDASFYGWMGSAGTTTPSSLQSTLREIIHPRLVVTTIKHREELYKTLQTFLAPEITGALHA